MEKERLVCGTDGASATGAGISTGAGGLVLCALALPRPKAVTAARQLSQRGKRLLTERADSRFRTAPTRLQRAWRSVVSCARGSPAWAEPASISQSKLGKLLPSKTDSVTLAGGSSTKMTRLSILRH